MRVTLQQRYDAEQQEAAFAAQLGGLDAGPWSSADFLRMVVTAGVGVVGVAYCWHGAANDLTYNAEVPWLIGAIGASGVIVLGMVYWLVAGFRTLRLEERKALLELLPMLPEQRRPVAAVSSPIFLDADYVAAEGMTHVHRADCILMTGKVVALRSSALDALDEGLSLCGVCLA